jgi:predicted CXXCH cytochrome family protein
LPEPFGFVIVLVVLATLIAAFLAFLPMQTPRPQFVGSKACESCHKTTYDRWVKTRMANIVVDPKAHPEAILGDFSTPNPVVSFKKEDIAFTYGSRWKQRYFTKVGNDYFVLPAQWDVTNRTWSRYHVENGTDWWTKYYPDENSKRPTGPLCDGCHSVNYNIATKQPTEWNVGCERCHGAGGDHVRAPSKQNIVNPARLDFVRGNDVCIQCHSQGQPLKKPLDGVYYDWPVGYQPGDRLSDYWELEEHKLGEETFTHFSEGSAHKNRMQGNDFVTSVMYRRGISCWSCHDVHGTGNRAEVIRTGNDLCLSCHGQTSPAGPRGSLEEHTHHSATSAGSQCIACHAPQIARQIANVNVRSHTFKFISPAETEQYKIPNACTGCHNDKTTAWASAELLKWVNVSPWRVGK